MKNLIHAELLKLRTTRMIYGLALATKLNAFFLAPLIVLEHVVRRLLAWRRV